MNNCQYKQPEFCVISLASQSPKYGYWTGTSFATPMVTGVAALILGSDHAAVPDSPSDLAKILRNTVTQVGHLNLGAGVINVTKLR